ncbi:MAG: hypothetical protein ACYCQI_16770 [Gammaproteobacteria bacterium]
MKKTISLKSIANTASLLSSDVMTDQIKLLYDNLFLSITTSLIMFFLVFITIYQTNHSIAVFLWFGCVILITLFRLGLIYIFRYHRQSNKFHLNVFLVGVAISQVSGD